MLIHNNKNCPCPYTSRKTHFICICACVTRRRGCLHIQLGFCWVGHLVFTLYTIIWLNDSSQWRRERAEREEGAKKSDLRTGAVILRQATLHKVCLTSPPPHISLFYTSITPLSLLLILSPISYVLSLLPLLSSDPLSFPHRLNRLGIPLRAVTRVQRTQQEWYLLVLALPQPVPLKTEYSQSEVLLKTSSI